MEKNMRLLQFLSRGTNYSNPANPHPTPKKRGKKKKKKDKRGESRLLYTYLYTPLYFQRSSEMVMYKPQKFVLPRNLHVTLSSVHVNPVMPCGTL